MEDKLLLVYSEVGRLIDELVIDMVMLDLSKEFDISHVVLLDKLKEIGVCTVMFGFGFFFFCPIVEVALV